MLYMLPLSWKGKHSFAFRSLRDQYTKNIQDKPTYDLSPYQVYHVIAIAKTNDLPWFVGIAHGFKFKPKVFHVKYVLDDM